MNRITTREAAIEENRAEEQYFAMTADRTDQEAWEDAELLPDMTEDARRWFLAERKRRQERAAPPTPPAAPKHAGPATTRGPAAGPEASPPPGRPVPH